LKCTLLWRSPAFSVQRSSIFHDACTRLGLPPENVLHVGDDPELDVIGAHRAGLRSAWLQRGTISWSKASRQSAVQPDWIVRSLAKLTDLLAPPARVSAR